MKIRARKAHARVDKVAAGFTIIETILFLAIAAMVFTGVIVGTNGAIRRQRYKDAVQSFTDDIRELYSLAENTEVLDYAGNVTCGLDEDGNGSGSTNNDRGRSDCSVYGVLARFQMNSKASTGKGENLEAYWLIGKDEKTIDKSKNHYDSTFLNEAKASTKIKIGGEIQQIEAKTSSLFWGAQIGYSCINAAGHEGSMGDLYDEAKFPYYCGTKAYASEPDIDNPLYMYLAVYRSPITGAIRTLVLANTNDYFNNSSTELLPFVNASLLSTDTDTSQTDTRGLFFARHEVNLCVTAGDGMSYDGGLRMISIKKDAGSMNDVILVEADSPENTCN